MRVHAKYYLGAVTVLFLVTSAWAGGGSNRKDSISLDVAQVTMVGNTQLQPGHYKLEATESTNQLNVLRGGKIIATVACEWIKLPQKSTQSVVLSDQNRVNEIHFEGTDQAVKLD